MCRLATYIGSPIPLKQFLLDPDHSLFVQSWQPKELNYAKLNADGFGFGWYQDDKTPAYYRNSLPIWNDTNLPALSEALTKDLWVCMVRSATSKYPVDHNNTQPFGDDKRLFIHNGFIENFRECARRAFVDRIDASIEADVVGLTDSEYLFALIRQFINENPDTDVMHILSDVYQWLSENLSDTKAMLNIIISEHNTLYAIRYAINEQAPSLYSLVSENATIIASERLSNDKGWQSVADRTLLIARKGQPLESIAL